MDQQFMTGNEACVYGALNAGARFYAGYPISPSTEIAELAAALLPGLGGVYFQMEDELAGLAAVIGASLGGFKAFTATSGPGFSLMQENIGFAVMAEVPCVIIPATGIATLPAQADVMQARWGSHGDYSIIVLAPSSVQECYDLTLEAFNLAERFRTPVILLMDAALAHLREVAVLRPAGRLPTTPRRHPRGAPEDYLPYRPGPDLVPALAVYGSPYIQRVTGLIHDEHGFSSSDPLVTANLLNRLRQKIEGFRAELPQPRYHGPNQVSCLIVAYGITVRAARAAALQAVARNLSAIGVIQLPAVWPFPAQLTRQKAGEVQAELVLVPEMNSGQLVGEVERAIAGVTPVRSVTRQDGILLNPDDILQDLAPRIEESTPDTTFPGLDQPW